MLDAATILLVPIQTWISIQFRRDRSWMSLRNVCEPKQRRRTRERAAMEETERESGKRRERERKKRGEKKVRRILERLEHA